jgi:effector-binding domain-containing protein
VSASVAVKEVPATIFVVSSHDDVTIPEIPTIARNEVDQMVEAIAAVGAEPVAPVTFIYHGADGTPDTKFQLEIAFPLSTRPASPVDPYDVKETPAFRCLATDYVGPMLDIMRGYALLFTELEEQGLAYTGESREIYRKWIGYESPDNVTELQIGVM